MLSCSDFAKHVLKLELWPEQKRILDAYFGGNKTHAVWALGRRCGKTLMASIAALYACFVLEEHYRRRVRKSEKWYILTIANDQSQAKLALNNIRQLLMDSPVTTACFRQFQHPPEPLEVRQW
jgi:phage terminase large subunit-like protein